MKLKGFNKKRESFKNSLKKNKEKLVQYSTLAVSILVLVVGIVFLSYAKYTSERTFGAYNANVGDFYEGQYKIAAYLNGTKQDEIPSRTYEENGVTKTAYVRNIQCTDGATGRWDTELWNLTVSGSTKTGTKCEIYFDNDTTLADNTTYATKYNPFPIGYVFLSTENNYASTLQNTFGGTWEKMTDGKYLKTGGGTGGSNTSTVSVKGAVQGHTLTINEIPSHTHTFTGTSVTTSETPNHTHTRGSMNITGSVVARNGTNFYSLMGGVGALYTTQRGDAGTNHARDDNGQKQYSDLHLDASKAWTGEKNFLLV